MTAVGVRRAKAAFFSGCKSHPAIAPARSNRSSHGSDEMAEAFGIACHELANLDFRCGSTTEVQREPQNVACWGQSGSRFRAAGCLFLAIGRLQPRAQPPASCRASEKPAQEPTLGGSISGRVLPDCGTRMLDDRSVKLMRSGQTYLLPASCN